jgi:uncharacterized repeat protein (TIGR01451 family)
MILSASMSLTATAQAQTSCAPIIGGPTPARYQKLFESGLITFTLNANGTATYLNMSECPIKVRLLSTTIAEDGYEDIYHSTPLETVQPGSSINLFVERPSCKYRLVIEPYTTLQRFGNGKPILHTKIYDTLPACFAPSYHTPEYAPVEARTTSYAVNMIPPPTNDVPTKNCILVKVSNYDAYGTLRYTDSGFTIRMDGNKKAITDSRGYAYFRSVSKGVHVVTQDQPENWSQLSVTPPQGKVNVFKDAACAVVTFKNQMAGSNKDIVLNVTSSPARIAPGQPITYTVSLVNNDNRPKIVLVRSTLDDATTYVKATNGAQLLDDKTVAWNDVYVPGKSTKNLTLYAMANGDTQNRQVVRLETRLNDQTHVEFTAITQRLISGNPLNVPAQDALVSMEPCRTDVQAGEQLCYTVTIRNPSTQPLYYLTVEEQHNERDIDMLFASDGGKITPGRVRWQMESLMPNETRRLTLRGMVLTTHGASGIHTVVSVNGDQLRTPETAVSDVSLVTMLPQTGVDIYRSGSDNLLFLTPIESKGTATLSFGSIILIFIGVLASVVSLTVTMKKFSWSRAA